MAQEFVCPQCGQRLTVAYVKPGQQVICPACRIPLQAATGGPGYVAPADPAMAGGPYAGPPGEAYGRPGVATAAAQKTSGMAIASLVVAVLGLPLSCCYGFGVILSIVALVLGIVALSGIKRSAVAVQGRGLAVTGVVLSLVNIVLVIVLAILAVVFGMKWGPEFMQMFERAERMQEVGRACRSYARTHGKFPDTLETLVDEGLTTSVIDSGTGEAFVYVGRGLDPKTDRGKIIVFSKDGGFMGTYNVILGDGSATMLPHADLARRLKAQGVPEDQIP